MALFVDHLSILSTAGPSGINNFNPGIFGTGFCKNPGIPGFSGSVLDWNFDPGFFVKIFGIFRIGHFAAFGGILVQAVLKESLLDCPRDTKSWSDPIHPVHFNL